MDKARLFFQYCPKLIVFSSDWQSVLLARRFGEADFDGTFSFIGGKMETSDESIVAGLRREKNEEIGEAAQVEVCLQDTRNLLFRKKDGSAMILPHHVARYLEGDIKLNAGEYSEYRWVPLDELKAFQPKIENIPAMASWALAFKGKLSASDFTLL